MNEFGEAVVACL